MKRLLKYAISFLVVVLLFPMTTNAQTIKRQKQKTEQTTKPKAKQGQKKQKPKAGSTDQSTKSQSKQRQDKSDGYTPPSDRRGVTPGPTQYTTAIINVKEIKDKLESNRYLVFLDTKGSVVGFNKNTHMYWHIYFGKATDISFDFSSADTLSIKTTEQYITYDLNSYKQIGNYNNLCYCISGTNKELSDKRIIGSGFLRKTRLLEGDSERPYFTMVDRKSVVEIPLHGNQSRIMTVHPKNSYEIVELYNTKLLRIINPDQFWSKTNYLVIQTE